MSAPKHTPGPWVSSEVNQLGSPVVVGFTVTAGRASVAKIAHRLSGFSAAPPNEAAEANARLIAAAPELLDALKAFVEAMAAVNPLDPADLPRRMGLLVPAARAAIAKAEGRGR